MIGQPTTVEVFRRSGASVVLGTIAAGIGAMAFAAFALVVLSGAVSGSLVDRLVFGGLLVFFAVLMGLAAVGALRRGGDTRIAEVSPEGVWLPAMGFLKWGEIAEVRLESIRSVGSSRAPVTRRFRRLGFVPRNPALRPDPTESVGWRMTQAYFAFVRRIAPDVRVGADDLAPFGVLEGELPADFERFMRAVGAHVGLVDADTAPARVLALNPHRSAPLSEPRSELAALAADAAGSDRRSAGPRRDFAPRRVTPLEILSSIVPLAAVLVLVVPVLAPSILGSGPTAFTSLLFLVLVLAAFVIPTAWRLVRTARRMQRQVGSTTLRVGPDGIWLPGMGVRPWDEVVIRTERAGAVRSLGGAPVERWRLVVAARDGATFGVNSDELDARFDEVLDLVRVYRPVAETG